MTPEQYIIKLEELIQVELEEVSHQKNEATQNQKFEFAYQYRLLEQKLQTLLLDLDLINHYHTE